MKRNVDFCQFQSLNEVDIWTVDLARFCTESMLTDCLSKMEWQRANLFRFQEHRRRFLGGRSVVRHILAHYVNTDPSALYFEYNSFGKPVLCWSGKAPVHFNVTHSNDLLLCAVAGLPLGVDLEPLALPSESDSIVRDFFSLSEYEKFKALPYSDQALAFTRCWTRKEAFIKAIGEGLSYPLDSFEVSLLPDELPRLLRIQGSETDAERWTIMELTTPPGYIASLAIACAAPLLQYVAFAEVLPELFRELTT